MMSVIFGGNVMKRTVFEQACTCREAIVSGTHRFMFLAGGCSGDARYECLAEVQRIWNLANRSADEALGLGRGHLHARMIHADSRHFAALRGQVYLASTRL